MNESKKNTMAIHPDIWVPGKKQKLLKYFSDGLTDQTHRHPHSPQVTMAKLNLINNINLPKPT